MKNVVIGFIVIVAIIAAAKGGFEWIADLLIDPGSAIPDEIPLP